MYLCICFSYSLVCLLFPLACLLCNHLLHILSTHAVMHHNHIETSVIQYTTLSCALCTCSSYYLGDTCCFLLLVPCVITCGSCIFFSTDVVMHHNHIKAGVMGVGCLTGSGFAICSVLHLGYFSVESIIITNNLLIIEFIDMLCYALFHSDYILITYCIMWCTLFPYDWPGDSKVTLILWVTIHTNSPATSIFLQQFSRKQKRTMCLSYGIGYGICVLH